MALRRPIVGISLGDPSGIGPEVTAKALGRTCVKRLLIPVVFGPRSVLDPHPVFARYAVCTAETLPARVTGPTRCHLPGNRHFLPGKPSRAGGLAQLASVEALIAAAACGKLDAMCTAPVSKAQITRAGVPFMGHTELLAERFGVETMMLMDGPRLKVALATNHLPLSEVPRALNRATLVRQLLLLSASLRALVGRAPRIAVCGLNPHAGEGGLLGREEVEVIGPAVAEAKRRGILCHGPFPADGLFARVSERPFPYDVALVMFHDQGLILSKALDFERTVNVTLGLPLPRTSPDHGVAYDLAGAGTADDAPMVAALEKAAELALKGLRGPPLPRRRT